MLGGAIGVGITLALVMVASALGWKSVMFSGTLLLISWVSIGFGVGEFAFNGRFRVLVMLLAVIIGLIGMAASFIAMAKLGFDVRG